MTEPELPHESEPAQPEVVCPFCGSRDTEPHSMFGSMLLMEQHYCRACRSIFERLRDEEGV